ncbi:MAG: M50 family metallopeptidase [Patescibacteria group bacterium]|nr:M50 family metallopeptidase [Patescibacteria group bacterium]
MSSVITFIIILSILVLIHELGHFLVARKFGVKVEEFGIGYPPRIWGKKIGETIYSVNWLPFGGFVRMLGEDSGEQVSNKKDLKKAFFNQTKRVRIMVLMAGVVMNFLLGVVLFGAIYTKIGIPEKVDYLVITGVVEGSPAEKIGLKVNDKIVNAGSINEFIDSIGAYGGKEYELELLDGRKLGVKPRTKEETPEGQGSLGITISNVDMVMYPYWQRPFRGILTGLKEAIAWGGEIVKSLGLMIVRLFKGDVPKDVAGVVGIYQISKNVSQEGLIATLQFMAILSINLSILNLLPIPALDGGRLLFIAIEAIMKKRIKPQVEQVIHLVGMALLLALMVLITIGDVKRLMG